MKNLPLVFGAVILAAAVALHLLGPRLGREFAATAATAEILLFVLAMVLLLSAFFYPKRR